MRVPLKQNVNLMLQLICIWFPSSQKDPDLFSLFERVAKSRDWPDDDRTLLQCVLTGKAQEAYASLSKADSRYYDIVKAAVLRAYELVPEAYRQRFRSFRKEDTGSCWIYTRSWDTVAGVWNLGLKLLKNCNLMVLEQIKKLHALWCCYFRQRKES